MTMKSFIRRYRASIDAEIRSAGVRGRITNEERGDWVANVEWLYLAAVRAGAYLPDGNINEGKVTA